DPVERRSGLAVGAEQHLRVVLAAHLGEDVGAGLDRLAARSLRRCDDLGGERVAGALGRESDDLREHPAVARLGDDAQAFGEEQPFLAAVLLVAQRAQPFDRCVGEGGDLPRDYSSPKRSSTRATSFSSASAAFGPLQWMVMLSPIAAPSIIRPMIEVPHTRLPSFSTSICASSSLAIATNLALARACSPRRLVIATSRLTAVKPLLPRGSPMRPKYICGRPPAPL